MVAGEDAEAAGVEVERLVEAELGAEVGDGFAAEGRGVACNPGVCGAEVVVEAEPDGIELGEGLDRREGGVDDGVGGARQHGRGAVLRGLPKFGREAREERLSVGVPDPPEVVGEGLQAEAKVHGASE